MSLCEVQAQPDTLAALLAGFADTSALPELSVTGVATDSRRVEPGALFLACAGEYRHGIEFVQQAVDRGAAAVAWDADAGPDITVPCIYVSDLKQQAGEIAARFHGFPAKSMSLIGITGTDGKTSCAHIVAQAYGRLGLACGYIGTLGYGFLADLAASTHTTPEPVSLQGYLAKMRDAQAQSVAIEVSSHGLDQGRVAGLEFDVAVLTNIGRDHLDYHASMEAYIAAKHRLFTSDGLKAAVLNVDDEHGLHWLTALPESVATVAYGLNATVIPGRARYVVARDVVAQPTGLVLDIQSSWGGVRIESPLLGRFNAYNLLAALAVLLVRGVEPQAAAQALSQVTTVRGRMELVNPGEGAGAHRPLVVVDYAHTPGALEQALQAIGEHVHGRVFCVFGCGGDRDTGKRPLMAQAAASRCDALWITDDNPRSESPEAIVADILAGLPENTPATVEHDRAKAIAAAIGSAVEGDAVLIAGKGHETYQIVGSERRQFDDREAATRVLEAA